MRHSEITHWSLRCKPRNNLQKCWKKTNCKNRAPKPQCPGTHFRAFQPQRNWRRRPEQPERKQIRRNKQNPKNPGESRFQQAGEHHWNLATNLDPEGDQHCHVQAWLFQLPGTWRKSRSLQRGEEESTDERILTDLQVAFTAGDVKVIASRPAQKLLQHLQYGRWQITEAHLCAQCGQGDQQASVLSRPPNARCQQCQRTTSEGKPAAPRTYQSGDRPPRSKGRDRCHLAMSNSRTAALKGRPDG